MLDKKREKYELEKVQFNITIGKVPAAVGDSPADDKFTR